MKKALLIGLFAVIFPTMALAATHRRELVTHAPPVPAPKANAICFNFGHDTLTSAAGVTQQLETLLKYSDCIRLAYAGFNNPLSESDALLAKSMGIRVTIGGDWYEHGSGEITSTDLPTYTSQVIQQAKWAQKN